MRRFLSALLLIAFLIPLVSIAWQPVEIVSGSNPATVMFYSEASVLGGASGAAGVQVLNTGAGVLTVSLWRYDTDRWNTALPADAALAGQAYYGICDSIYTLAAGEELFLTDITSGRRPHLAYITRPSITSAKVLWQ